MYVKEFLKPIHVNRIERLKSYFKSEAGKVQKTLNKKNKLMEEVEHLHAQVALEKLKWVCHPFLNLEYKYNI